MKKMLALFLLLTFLGSIHAAIGYGESNVFSITSETHSEDSVIPLNQQLTYMQPAYPNPFRQGNDTCISVNVKAGETATCTIYNLKGQVIKTQYLASGKHEFRWDGYDNREKACANGVYFVKLRSDSISSTAKLLLMK